MRHLRPWASRAALVALGLAASLFMLEVLLRAAGMIYELRPAAQRDVNLVAGDNTFRVLCLGESTTAGITWGDSAYPKQLERILNERASGRTTFAVINGGKVATTTDVILADLPGMLDEYRPHVVVAMMGINDSNPVDPSFQVGGTLRIWKLFKMLYNHYRTPPASQDVEHLLKRARATMKNWPDVAVELAQRVVDMKPDDPRPHLILGEARLKQKQVGLAVQSYLNALEADGSAVVAHAFTVDDKLIDILDGALSRTMTNSDALAARAVLAMRRSNFADARQYAQRATEMDPKNATAWVVYGRTLQLSGSVMEAFSAFSAAAEANSRVVQLLEKNGQLESPLLLSVIESERFAELLENAGPTTSEERWLRQVQENIGRRFEQLQLVDTWKHIAEGETGEAEQSLRHLTDPDAEVDPSMRLRAYGQLAILSWQRGDAAAAERYHDLIEGALADWVNPTTRDNYLSMADILEERGIPLVAVQYPMRRLEPLRRMLGSAPGVVFVSNERVFKDAVLGRPYSEIFVDLFAGDFGHMTVEGNRLLAANVSEVILKLAGLGSGKTADVAVVGEK